MAEGHSIEWKGRQILGEYLAAAGRTVEKSPDRTFDLIVDGEYAEVKAKGNGWDKFDFISLTTAQQQALGNKLKRVFIVLNVNQPEKAEIVEIHADDLQNCVCRKIIHYEWNKGAIQHLRKRQRTIQ